MRVRAAQHGAVEHPLELDVVDDAVKRAVDRMSRLDDVERIAALIKKVSVNRSVTRRATHATARPIATVSAAEISPSNSAGASRSVRPRSTSRCTARSCTADVRLASPRSKIPATRASGAAEVQVRLDGCQSPCAHCGGSAASSGAARPISGTRTSPKSSCQRRPARYAASAGRAAGQRGARRDQTG